MKKKCIAFLIAAAMVLTMAGCQKGGEEESSESNKKYEVALSMDVGSIDDRSFNQGSWEGVQAYAKEHNLTSKYYEPTEKSDDAYTKSLELAVKGGAKIVVCPGYLYEVPVYNMQKKYPDVKFVILDGSPHDGNGNSEIMDNTHSIFYAEEQAGFLAGYAAVMDGNRKLGFMGGIAVPAVIRFGYGFIQGADYAGKQLGLSKGDLEMKYTYVGNFDATPDNMSKAAAWYNEGTDTIFACGGGVGNSVMKAAMFVDKTVIGVDVDQSGESDTVITSAVKNLQKSVYDVLDSFYKGKFEGGVSVVLGSESGNVLLPMKNSKFKTFSQADYDEIYQMIVDGKIQIHKDDVAQDAKGVPTEIVVTELIK